MTFPLIVALHFILGTPHKNQEHAEVTCVAVDMENASEFAGGPYCGIYSVYCALRSLEINVSFDQLVSKRYVGSFKGSTLAELQDAVHEAGAYSMPLQGLTPAALRLSPYPLILHVKRPGHNMPYAHWVAYLGMTTDNKVRLIDPPFALADLPIADLLALWDGVALAISTEPISTTTFWLFSSIDQAIALCLGMVSAFVMYSCRKLLKRPFVATSAILLSTAISALLYHFLNEEGIARNPSACGLVAGGHFKPVLEKCNFSELNQQLFSYSVQLVDARGPEAYKAYHLPGAINLPIYAGLAERSAVYAQLPRNRKIVVYCNSENCPWAETIASDLALRGNLEFALYPGGVMDWIKQTISNK